MSTFDRTPLEVFDDAELRAELHAAFGVPARAPDSVLEDMRPRLRATRRRYVVTHASTIATALIVGVLVVAGLRGGSPANGVRIETRPAGEPTQTVPTHPAPGHGPPTSTTTVSPKTTHKLSTALGGSTPTVPSPSGPTSPTLVPPAGGPSLTVPPAVTVPRNGAPGDGSRGGETPTPTTTSAPSTTTTPSEPSTTTTTVPASGTQTFKVYDRAGTLLGTVEVSWQGPSLTFDGANPCAACTFVKSQGDPNELDVTFTDTTDNATAHLHLEMSSTPAWHPIVD
jgi:hypothetical protein